MANQQFVVSFKMPKNILHATEAINRMMRDKWSKDAPINLCDLPKDNNAIVHMPIIRCITETDDAVQFLFQRTIQLLDRVNPKPINLLMEKIELRNDLVFWRVEEGFKTNRSGFRQLTSALLDGHRGIGGLHEFSSNGFPLLKSWTPTENRNNRFYHDPNVRNWRVTAGRVRKELTFNELNLPRKWALDGQIPAIIIGRCSGGRLIRVLATIPLI
ncbi:hypothetical protein COY25_03275 [Candidatus Uhrbacteria bacterium CG_4_10_14_0_2_um_filter_41_7]|uniref:Uncharacterized protein n=1 Tax=Candidatus Uhrbacteria bacterium CG_4_9_14_3_um_filter_41_35 TaxID=1975034 RepID=A0A2M7XGS5_9BACT|nr:MAG: hypothetical protein COV92_00555 [Candidatus Uhrbacteria bacterium CG11_big_fil_rev_8_21_14_0_20_41_9]PIZ53614.1 MAG: hypothetical protein COY25_03275 [Candidatus Uhrbacteria bacterium CG_4_10_14_0_2_um_filter_41_7]PJA47077.1 MAG: hypothetical protein CO173_00230 [Candidatus Uhrbacteria bacterium CG_4_9_14_3_um_filter_41_35]